MQFQITGTLHKREVEFELKLQQEFFHSIKRCVMFLEAYLNLDVISNHRNTLQA